MIRPLRVALAAVDERDLPGSEDASALGPGERATLAGMSVPVRRRSFLLGRLAARRALALLDPPLAPSDVPVEVLAAVDGAPEVVVGGRRLPVSLSISHSGGRGVCAACHGHLALGVDIEEIAPRGPGLVEDFFTTTERALVASAPEPSRAVVTNLIWSAKESALKALRDGLRRDTREVVVAFPPYAGAELDAGPPGWRRLGACSLDGRRFLGHWRRDGKHVVTLLADAEIVPPHWPTPSI